MNGRSTSFVCTPFYFALSYKLNNCMTEETTALLEYQLDTVEKLLIMNEEEDITVKDVLLLPSTMFHLIVDDWRKYTTSDKIVFLLIWSPLLWPILTLLMKI